MKDLPEDPSLEELTEIVKAIIEETYGPIDDLIWASDGNEGLLGYFLSRRDDGDEIYEFEAGGGVTSYQLTDLQSLPKEL